LNAEAGGTAEGIADETGGDRQPKV
jgi:hypothetical protein